MLFTFLFVFIAIVPTYELLRRYKNFSSLFFIFAPILLAGFWINSGDMDWFKWAKIYSVALASFLINLTRYKTFSKNKSLFNTIYIVVGINILEAVINDIPHLDLPSVINIFIGIFLIFTLFKKPRNISVSTNKTKDFYAPNFNLLWIVCYNIWDWVYIYSEYPQFAMKHIFVLWLVFFMELFRPGSWLQIRTFTLTTYLIVSFTFSPYLNRFFPTMIYNRSFALALVLINLCLLVFYQLSQPNNKRKNFTKKYFSKKTSTLFYFFQKK